MLPLHDFSPADRASLHLVQLTTAASSPLVIHSFEESNQLTKIIPTEIGMLTEIEHLNLSE